jgi:hypothetical protein
MDEHGSITAWKRVNGGFRRMAETELGQEQLCPSCGELWPLDREFFVVSRGGISYECKACIDERRRSSKCEVAMPQVV